jgi:hypothetical protein
MANGSLKNSMGRLFGGENKLAYFSLQTASTLTPMQIHRDFPLSGAFKRPVTCSRIFLRGLSELERPEGAGERTP